jgi:hypothetical protein
MLLAFLTIFFMILNICAKPEYASCSPMSPDLTSYIFLHKYCPSGRYFVSELPLVSFPMSTYFPATMVTMQVMQVQDGV